MSGALQRGVAFAAALVLLAALGWTILRPAGQYRVTAFFTGTVGLYPGSEVRILGIDVGDDHRHHRTRRQGARRDDASTTTTTSLPTPMPSSWRRRWCPTATCSSHRSTTAARRWRTAPRCRWTAPPLRSSSTRSTARSTSCPRRSAPRRQRERRPVGPGRRRRGQPRGQRRGAQPDADRLLAGRARRWPRTATTCSPRWTTCRCSPARWPPSTRRWAQFNDNMAAVADLLAGEREDLARAFELLNQALADVAGFIQDNIDLVTTNVNRLADVTLALVQQRTALAEVLEVAPAALGNLSHAYNPDYGTLDTRDNGLGAQERRRSSSAVCWPSSGACSCRPGSTSATRWLPAAADRAHLRPAALRRRRRRRRSDDLNGNGSADLEELLAGAAGRRRCRLARRPADRAAAGRGRRPSRRRCSASTPPRCGGRPPSPPACCCSAAAGSAAPTRSTCPAAPTSATTRTRCRSSSSTCSTWCRSPASGSPTSRWAGSRRSSSTRTGPPS